MLSKEDEKSLVASTSESPKPKFQLTLRIFRFCSWKDYLLIAAGVIGNVAAGVLLPIFFLVFGDLLNVFGDPTAGTDKSFAYYCKFQVYLGIGSFFGSWVGSSAFEWAAERQLRRIREEYLKAIMRQEMGWFDTHDSGTLSAQLNQNCILIRDAIGVKLGQIFLFLSMFVGGYVVGFVKGWKLSLVITAVLPLLAGAGFFMMYMITAGGSRSRQAYQLAGAVAEEALGNIRTVTAFGAQEKTMDRYVENLDTSFKTGVRGGLGQGLGMGLVLLVEYLTFALGFWYGGELVARDIESGCNPDLTSCFRGGNALTVFLCVVIAALVVGQSGPNISSFAKGSSAALDLFALIDRKTLIDPYSTQGHKDGPIKGEIIFKNVRFRFPSRPEQMVFANLNLRIPAGETVALVGASGCGKSTTIQLIERYYDCSDGEVTIDGRDITSYNLPWLRSQMSIVGQEPRLFARTVAENIAFGKLGSSREEIESAAKNANASTFIKDFPEGFDTFVGEGGGQLSGGQKQRIAIARAILRDPAILILDEATSALDNESEKIVQDTLDELIKRRKRTTIVIAHRLTTVRNADRIIVLDNPSGIGSIVVEEGSHDELMNIPDGLYYNLVKSQTGDRSPESRKRDVSIAALSEEFGIRRSSLSNYSIGIGRSSRAPSIPPSLPPEKVSSFIALSRKYSLAQSSTVPQKELSGLSSADIKKRCFGLLPAKKGSKKMKTKNATDIKPAPPMRRVFANLKPDAFKVFLGVIGACINGCAWPIFAVIYSKFIGVYFLPNPDDIRHESAFWSYIFIALGVTFFIGASLQTSFFEWAGQRLIRELRKKTLHNLLYQEMAFFDNPDNSTGSLSQVLSSDVVLVKGWVGDNTGIFFQNLVAIICGVIISFVASPRLAAVTLAAFLVMAPASILEMQAMQGSTKNVEASAETAGFIMNESIYGIRTVAAFCLEQTMLDSYARVVDREYRVGRKNAILFGLFFGFSQFAQYAGQALALWYGGKLLEQGRIDNVEEMMMAIFALVFAAMGFGQAAIFATDSKKAKEAAKNVYWVLDRQSKIDARDPHGVSPEIVGEIEVRQISFRYPMRQEVPIFKDLSFSITEGETVALVGASGCGKSTIIQLLERFYDIMASNSGRTGTFKLDKHDLRDINIKYLRSQIGLVSQEPSLFNTSIAQNILYGREEASLEDVIKAAKMSNAHDFIMQFPDGYDTLVGKGGGQLSGGQKQRISIARAIIRDPPILLLDEATSALDNESERIVQAALDNLLSQRKRTTIIVAHRLSTIRNADKIIVFSNDNQEGSVVAEVGDHDSLVKKPDGIYAGLVKIATAADKTA